MSWSGTSVISVGASGIRCFTITAATALPVTGVCLTVSILGHFPPAYLDMLAKTADRGRSGRCSHGPSSSDHCGALERTFRFPVSDSGNCVPASVSLLFCRNGLQPGGELFRRLCGPVGQRGNRIERPGGGPGFSAAAGKNGFLEV